MQNITIFSLLYTIFSSIHTKILTEQDLRSSDVRGAAWPHLETIAFLSGDEGADGLVPFVFRGRPCRAPAGQRQMCSSKVLPASLAAEALIPASLL